MIADLTLMNERLSSNGDNNSYSPENYQSDKNRNPADGALELELAQTKVFITSVNPVLCVNDLGTTR